MGRGSLRRLVLVALATTLPGCFADIGDVVKGSDAGTSSGGSSSGGASASSSGSNGQGNGQGSGADGSVCVNTAPCASVATSCLQKPTCLCLAAVCGSGGTTCTTSNNSIDLLCGQGGLVCQGKTDGSGLVCVTGTGDICCQ